MRARRSAVWVYGVAEYVRRERLAELERKAWNQVLGIFVAALATAVGILVVVYLNWG